MQTTILLVEDDAVLRGGLAELFTREGYRVIEATSPREAVMRSIMRPRIAAVRGS